MYEIIVTAGWVAHVNKKKINLKEQKERIIATAEIMKWGAESLKLERESIIKSLYLII